MTKEQLDAYFQSNSAKIKGKIVLTGAPTTVPVTILPSARRRDDADVRNTFGNDGPTAGGPPGGGPAATPADPQAAAGNPGGASSSISSSSPPAPLARINDAGRDHGQIRAFNNRTFDVTKAVPTLVMRNEDYGRISRLLADGSDVQLEFNIVNRTYPEGKTQYNVIAEIPGTDRAQEVVMLGGHLDSWHAATGATDNAIGCAVMMEAIRILQAIGVKPRRTIRLALWSGEEQGLLGSQAYVKEHFGTFENPKPEYANFAGYFNIDSGTGRARGHDGVRTADKPPRSCDRPSHRLPTTGCSARRRRAAGDVADQITPRSTKPACPASAWARIRSSTAPTPGTPISTPTSASSKPMRSSPPWPSRPRSITWPCATRSSRASRKTRCRLHRHRRPLSRRQRNARIRRGHEGHEDSKPLQIDLRDFVFFVASFSDFISEPWTVDRRPPRRHP